MRIYVASGLQNRERVVLAMDRLRSLGHEITYDWTRHGDVRSLGEARMEEVAQNETCGVTGADIVLLLLPGGKGTHIELGLSLATAKTKRILLWSETGVEFGGGADTCVFYHHPAIERIACPFDELMQTLEKL